MVELQNRTPHRRACADIVLKPAPQLRATLPLPDELLLMICTLLPRLDLLAFSHVCRHFHTLSFTPSLHLPHTRGHLVPTTPPPDPAILRTLTLRDPHVLLFARHLFASVDTGCIGVVTYGLNHAHQPGARFTKLFFALDTRRSTVTITGETLSGDIRLGLQFACVPGGWQDPEVCVPAASGERHTYYPLPWSWRAEEGRLGLWIVVRDERQEGQVVVVSPGRSEELLVARKVVFPDTCAWVTRVMWQMSRPPGSMHGEVTLAPAEHVYAVPYPCDYGARPGSEVLAVVVTMKGQDEMKVAWEEFSGQGPAVSVLRRLRLAGILDDPAMVETIVSEGIEVLIAEPGYEPT